MLQQVSSPSISTLIPDIYQLVGKKTGWFNDILASDMAKEISLKMQSRFKPDERQGSLRISKLGLTCPCSLWYSVHHPELAEPLPGWAQIKFMYGDLIESMVIALAKAAGHDVTGEQDRVVVDGIVGHRDCVIDGCIVDVKSANSRSFEKFKRGELEKDPFASSYLDQLDGYLVGSYDDPLVRQTDRAYLLAVDKSLGHMVLYRHELRRDHILERIRRYKEIVGRVSPPSCTCQSVPDGQSGNLILDKKASYNPFKYCCKPHTRQFIFSNGPRYFTRLVRRPQEHVMEVDKYGNILNMGFN